MAMRVLRSVMPASLGTKGFLFGISWLAFTVHAVSAATVTLKQNDADSYYALTDASRWNGDAETFPDSATDYYVGAKQTIRTNPSADIVFGGNSLILGNAADKASATFAFRTSKNHGDRILQFTGDEGLVLGYGILDNWNECCTVVSGKVSVASTSSRPFVVYASTKPNQDKSERKVNCQFEGTLQSGENASLVFYSAINAEDAAKSCYRILADASQYLGMISVCQTSKGVSQSRNRVTLELGSSDFGGTVKMSRRTTLEPCMLGAVSKVQNLELNSDAALSLRWDATSQKGAGIAVEGNLNVDGIVEVRPSRLNTSYGESAFAVPVLKAPQGTSLSADNFVFIASVDKDYDEFVLPVVALEVVADEDGRDVLWAVTRPVLQSAGNDANGKTCSLCYDQYAPLSNWPNGAEATTEFDYLSQYTIRTPASVASARFPGHSLVFKSTSGQVSHLALRCPVVEIPDLRIDLSANHFELDFYSGGDTSTNSFAPLGTIAVKGNLKILSDSAKSKKLYLYPGKKRLIRIDSNISGNGNIDARLAVDEAGECCHVELAGDNSKWAGICYLTKKPTDDASYSCLLFREAKNMGGAMESFTWKALHLGNSGRLHPLQSVTLSEPTRGVYVAGKNCRVEVEGEIEFTLLQRISYEGTLTKTGTGTFALGGGKPLFAGSETLPPTEGKNRLVIAEGSFTPMSSEAFDGVSVSFAEGTRIALRIPDDFENGIGRWGMALTNAVSSLELPESGVSVSIPETPPPSMRSFRLPVCTVRADSAAGLRGKLVLAKRYPYPHHISTLVETENADGTVTFAVVTERSGFVVNVR